MKHLLTALILQLVSMAALAGNVSNVFGEGVFGAKWGASKEEVMKSLPSGKENDDFGIVTYSIKDGRSLFGVERNKKNYIKFTFDANNKLMGVSIQFPLRETDDYGALLFKLNTTFGQGKGVPNSFGVNMVKWPQEKELSIGLSHIPGNFSIGELIFTIEYVPAPAAVPKSELGF